MDETCVKCGSRANAENVICLECAVEDAATRALRNELKRFTVSPWYGETRNVFYVLRHDPTNPEDWEAVASFPTRAEAVDFAERVSR